TQKRLHIGQGWVACSLPFPQEWCRSVSAGLIGSKLLDGIARWKRWLPRAHWEHARPALRPASKPVRAQPQSSETGNRMAGLFERT
ncbi:Phage protein, partial [Dysosmobacter welbionis]